MDQKLLIYPCRFHLILCNPHFGGNTGVAGRGRGGMGTVSVVVTSGVELVGRSAEQGAVRRHRLTRANQLVVARERNIVDVVPSVAEIATGERSRVERQSRWRCVAAVVGEARMFRPDATVPTYRSDSRFAPASRAT